MKTFIYKVTDTGSKGYNQTVTVYLQHGHKPPEWIGLNDKINTASTKGRYAEACKVVADHTTHRLSKNGYSMKSKSINIYYV